jgi:hypothetical protein
MANCWQILRRFFNAKHALDLIGGRKERKRINRETKAVLCVLFIFATLR